MIFLLFFSFFSSVLPNTSGGGGDGGGAVADEWRGGGAVVWGGVWCGRPSRETHTLHFSKQAASGEPPSIMSLWR